MISKDKATLEKYARFYDERHRGTADESGEIYLRDWFKTHRYLNKAALVAVAKWKAPRIIRHCEKNSEKFIEEITRFALGSSNEEVQIKALMVLDGVSWPVASVILHFAFPEKYTVLDFRALEALGLPQPTQYNYGFWQKYCSETRNLSLKTGLSLRVIDKALWEYSKRHGRE